MPTCDTGKVTTLQCTDNDSSCVGIKSIVNNSNGTTTITLTNGKSTTYQSRGAKGAKGDKGDTGATGTSLMHSNPESIPTTTSGSYETLDAFTTDHTEDTKTLDVVGDAIRVYARFKLTNNPTATGINTQLIINGSGLANLILGAFVVGTSNVANGMIELFCDIILSDATTNAQQLLVLLKGNVGNDIGLGVCSFNSAGSVVIAAAKQTMGGVGVDFSTNDYTISAQARSQAIGDISLDYFSATKLKLQQ